MNSSIRNLQISSQKELRGIATPGTENLYGVVEIKDKGAVQNWLAENCEKSDATLFSISEQMLAALKICMTWFEKHSPTAPCIDRKVWIHPMLEMISKTISKAEGL